MDYMTDAQGRQVPVDLVSPLDKLRDETVCSVIDRALSVRSILSEFKAEVRSEIETFLDLSAEQYDKVYGGRKGNVTLTSFDGRYKVIIAVNEHIVFDERLQVAKQIIDECITRWAEGSRSEIRALVNDAFYVDKAGKINTGRILGLRRLEIHDPEWQKAMKAITDSIQVSGSKQYLRIYERNDEGNYTQIALDLAAV